MTKNGVVEFETVFEFGQRGVIALDVHQNVVRLVQLLDRIGELAASPVFETVDLPCTCGNKCLVALDHRRDLLTLVRVDD